MQYVGQELHLFRNATAWKAYYGKVIKSYIEGDVLEVGGGIGGTTPYIVSEAVRSYTIIEPDPGLRTVLQTNVSTLPAATQVRTTEKLVKELPPTPSYDVIVYIDVLEHIENDQEEVEEAFKRLNPGGRLIVLSPAFETLYSPFDDAVGHYHRYTQKSLSALMPTNAHIIKARYFDSVGAVLSLGNRWLTKDSMPTEKQILFWNRFIIPLSRLVDPLFKKWWGRSVLVIAEKHLRHINLDD